MKGRNFYVSLILLVWFWTLHFFFFFFFFNVSSLSGIDDFYLRFLQAKLPSCSEGLVAFACSQSAYFAGICDFKPDFSTVLVTLFPAPLQELSFKVIE